MCVDPLTLTAIGTVISAGTSVFQGVQAQQTANYQAAVQRENANRAENAARRTEAQGVRARQDQQLRTASVLGRQRAIFAERNLALGGSALDVLTDTATVGALDEATISRNYAGQAEAYRNQASNFQAQATISEMSGRSALLGGVLGGFGTLASGFGSVAERWYDPDSMARAGGVGGLY